MPAALLRVRFGTVGAQGTDVKIRNIENGYVPLQILIQIEDHEGGGGSRIDGDSLAEEGVIGSRHHLGAQVDNGGIMDPQKLFGSLFKDGLQAVGDLIV